MLCGVNPPPLTVMLPQQRRASLVALFGQLHPGRGILWAEHQREVEFSFSVPPALCLGHAPQLRVLRGDLSADGQLVGDVLHPLLNHMTDGQSHKI